MDVKDAIETAKAYLSNVYADSERISDVRLEEIRYDDESRRWLITLEFSRPLNEGPVTRAREMLERLSELQVGRRTQKVITVSDRSGQAVGMENKQAA